MRGVCRGLSLTKIPQILLPPALQKSATNLTFTRIPGRIVVQILKLRHYSVLNTLSKTRLFRTIRSTSFCRLCIYRSLQKDFYIRNHIYNNVALPDGNQHSPLISPHCHGSKINRHDRIFNLLKIHR